MLFSNTLFRPPPNTNPRNVICIKRLIPWMITLSAICICTVSFVSMFQGTLWYDNEGMPTGNRSPLRTLLTIKENGWMRAVATLFHSKHGSQYPLQDIETEVEKQWDIGQAYFAERNVIQIQSGEFSAEQVKFWRSTGWLNFHFGKVPKKEVWVTEKFYDSKGLRLSEAFSFFTTFFGSIIEKQTTVKKRLVQSKVPNALILFEPVSWKTMVCKFTKFHETHGYGSDPGEPQLMILQGFIQKEQRKGVYLLQDTHGLNKGGIIQIPENELHRMDYTVWFVENPEEKADKEWKEKYPEIDRPASPMVRDQYEEPICYMFAAASLLRTKQRDPIPHAILVDEMRKIEEELRGFWEEFKRQYDVNKAQGMRYWMESEWWKLTQSPEMKYVFPRGWLSHILEDSLSDDGDAKMIIQKFLNSHGFSFVEKFYAKSKISDQEPKIQQMLQKERALIALSDSSLERVKEGLDKSPPVKESEEGHMMMLETFKFDTETGEYIVKNSHGPTGGSRGTKDGKIHIPEEVFKELDYYVYFIGETRSRHTSLEANDWMWAVATLYQSRRGKHNSLQGIVAEVEEQWYTYLAFLAERERIKLSSHQSGRWTDEQKDYWRESGWWDFNLRKKRNGELRVTDKFFQSQGLQLSTGVDFLCPSEPQVWLMHRVKLHSALILFGDFHWKKIVSKYTKVQESNEDDLGGSQLMVLQRFARGLCILQDTRGLNGIDPSESARSTIEIPTSELWTMDFEVWFVEDLPPRSIEPGISSPYRFKAKGKQSSDRKDVYLIQFIDLKTNQKKWFAINVMQEIEMIRQNEIRGEATLARSFDVYTGKKKHFRRLQLNRKCTQQPHVLEIEWDTSNIKVTKIQGLLSTEVSELPETDFDRDLRELELLAFAEILANEGYEFGDLEIAVFADPEELEDIGFTGEQVRRMVTYFRIRRIEHIIERINRESDEYYTTTLRWATYTD